MDKDTAFLQGGGDGSGGNNRTAYCESYFLDLNTKQWTPGPNITKCRHYHTCSLIKNDISGHREIVVVGGWDELEKAIDEVEIIDLDTLQVRNGRWDSDLCITSFRKYIYIMCLLSINFIAHLQPPISPILHHAMHIFTLMTHS